MWRGCKQSLHVHAAYPYSLQKPVRKVQKLSWKTLSKLRSHIESHSNTKKCSVVRRASVYASVDAIEQKDPYNSVAIECKWDKSRNFIGTLLFKILFKPLNTHSYFKFQVHPRTQKGRTSFEKDKTWWTKNQDIRPEDNHDEGLVYSSSDDGAGTGTGTDTSAAALVNKAPAKKP
jgi:mannose-6-phosphate isomerase class I